MSLFSYKAQDKDGKIVEDVIQAVNRQEVASLLKSDDLKILTIKNIDKGLGSVYIGGVSVAEKSAFCRFLATMLRAGLPLPEAIEIIIEETKNMRFKKILLDISFQVRKGNSLSGVLSKYKNEFSPVFLTVVKAGEESGTLEKSFDYLAKELLASHELVQKVKGALMYPIVIITAMLANAVIMMTFVLPKISEVFTQLNVEMPIMTRIVLKFGNFVGDNMFLVLGGFLCFVFLIAVIFIVNKTRRLIYGIFVRLPIVKDVVNQIDVARFSRTLSTLLRSGVPIMVALEVSSGVVSQTALKKQAKEFSKGVERGESLSEVLSRGKEVFPVTLAQTIKAGEKTGSLEIVLEELADFYEREVDFSLKRLTALLEPLLMLIIGVAVGGMVIIMITPIYNIVGGLEGSV